MPIFGADGQVLSSDNPFKQKKLEDYDPMSQAEMDHLYKICDGLIEQQVPPSVPAAVPTEGLIRLVRTVLDIIPRSEVVPEEPSSVAKAEQGK
jgi:hypothetical protein